MADYFTHRADVYVKKFDVIKLIKDVKVTNYALTRLAIDPQHVFEFKEEILWVERNEDLYSAVHYKNRCAVLLNRVEWISVKDTVDVDVPVYDYRIVIAGGRDFDNYEAMAQWLDGLFYRISKSKRKSIQIVSGTAKGVDRLGERYAIERGYAIKRFPADWNGPHKRGAGHVRNAEMADYGNYLCLVWNLKSKGSGGMLKLAERKKLNIRIMIY